MLRERLALGKGTQRGGVAWAGIQRLQQCILASELIVRAGWSTSRQLELARFEAVRRSSKRRVFPGPHSLQRVSLLQNVLPLRIL